jgi:hypothetical protein
MRYWQYGVACLAAVLFASTAGAQAPVGGQNLYQQRAEEERAKFQERIRAAEAKPDAGMERRGPWGLLTLLGPAAPEKAATPPPAPPVVLPPGGVWVHGPYGPVLVRRGILGRPWVPPPGP